MREGDRDEEETDKLSLVLTLGVLGREEMDDFRHEHGFNNLGLTTTSLLGPLNIIPQQISSFRQKDMSRKDIMLWSKSLRKLCSLLGFFILGAELRPREDLDLCELVFRSG